MPRSQSLHSRRPAGAAAPAHDTSCTHLLTPGVAACRPRALGKEGKPGRRAKALRPMYRGYVCFSPVALHRHWYKQHAFLRGPSPEVSRGLASRKSHLTQLATAPSPSMLTARVAALARSGRRRLQRTCHGFAACHTLPQGAPQELTCCFKETSNLFSACLRTPVRAWQA